MFYGFFSDRLPNFPAKKASRVSKKGFHLFIDLSERRSFLLETDDTTLAFWGRIYGASDLTALFKPMVNRFENDGDATRFFNILEGDFALVLFDHVKRHAYIGRDRFARGEIYWSKRPYISFFTHPSYFFGETGLKPELNLRPLWDHFSIGAITPPETIYKSVYTPAAGEYVKLDSIGEEEKVLYWSPLKSVKEGLIKKTDDAEYMIEALRRCFTEKVSEEIAPYKKVGVGLSGGMDSAAILGAARKSFTGEIVAVTIGPHGPDSPDLPRARTSAAFNNAKHIEYYPVAGDLDDFPLLMGSLAQPFRSNHSFANYQIAKKVSENGGECVLWGYGADLILGNAGYCKRFFYLEEDLWPALMVNPAISILNYMPQNRYVTGLLNRLLWRTDIDHASLSEKYFRTCKKPRFFQERRLFKESFLNLGREKEILSRIEQILTDNDELIIDRILDVDLRVIHVYQQVSCAHQASRLKGVDSIITYYNKDYAEINLMATNGIRSLDGWNKYVLREAFSPLVHKDIYRGKRGACIIDWNKIIGGPFRDAVIRYLKSSSIVREIFKIEYLDRLDGMIKHPGLMYLNLTGLALWYDVNFKGVSLNTPLSTLIDYKWQNQDRKIV